MDSFRFQRLLRKIIIGAAWKTKHHSPQPTYKAENFPEFKKLLFGFKISLKFLEQGIDNICNIVCNFVVIVVAKLHEKIHYLNLDNCLFFLTPI